MQLHESLATFVLVGLAIGGLQSAVGSQSTVDRGQTPVNNRQTVSRPSGVNVIAGRSKVATRYGIVAASQNQRSQHQNRATAMKLLISKLYAQQVDAQKQEMERFYGEKGSVSWGNQIRSYVFQPYRMVKDLRTGVQTSNVQGVMDGDLDEFVNGWLRAGCPAKRMQGIKDEDE